MRYINEIFDSDEGGGVWYAFAFFFSGLIVIYLLISNYTFNINAREVDNAVQSAVLNIVTGNYKESFDGVKSGMYANLTFSQDSNGFEVINFGNASTIYEELSSVLNLDETNGSYCKKDFYCISDVKMKILSAPLEMYSNQKYTAEISFKIRHFWSGMLKGFSFDYTKKLSANYTPKYYTPGA